MLISGDLITCTVHSAADSKKSVPVIFNIALLSNTIDLFLLSYVNEQLYISK